MTGSLRRSSFDDLAACLRGEWPAGADWTDVAREANRYLVAPALYAALRRSGGLAAVPADLADYLRLLYDLNCERNARLVEQALEAVAALNAAGMEPLLLKGAGVVLTAPPDRRGERMMSDLDLVVAAGRVPDAMSQLSALGYRVLSTDVGSHAHASLFRPEDPGAIDLHQRPPGPSGFYDEDGRPAEEPIALGGVRARLPSPTERAIHLIVHDMMHDGLLRRGRLELRHLLDLRDLVAQGVDWKAIGQRLSTRPGAWALQLSVLNLRELLHVEIPDAGHVDRFTRVLYRRQMLKIRRPWFRRLDEALFPFLYPGWSRLRAVARRRR